jgi:hypothetical protein
VGGESYVIRILRRDISDVLLGVPAESEIENTIVAAETGVGPAVVASLPELPALVLEYIEGATLHLEDVRSTANIPCIARACRRLHDEARPFVNDFDIFRQLDGFLDICRRNALRIPDGYESYLPVIERIEATVKAGAPAPVSCHNDLLAENFMPARPLLRSRRHRRRERLHPRRCRDALRRLLWRAFASPDGAVAAVSHRVELHLDAVVLGAQRDARAEPGCRLRLLGRGARQWGQAVRDLEGDDLGLLLDRAAGG